MENHSCLLLLTEAYKEHRENHLNLTSFPKMDGTAVYSGRCAAETAYSPGDSRVAYTFTCTPGLSVNWMRSWFRALSRT